MNKMALLKGVGLTLLAVLVGIVTLGVCFYVAPLSFPLLVVSAVVGVSSGLELLNEAFKAFKTIFSPTTPKKGLEIYNFTHAPKTAQTCKKFPDLPTKMVPEPRTVVSLNDYSAEKPSKLSTFFGAATRKLSTFFSCGKRADLPDLEICPLPEEDGEGPAPSSVSQSSKAY